MKPRIKRFKIQETQNIPKTFLPVRLEKNESELRLCDDNAYFEISKSQTLLQKILRLCLFFSHKSQLCTHNLETSVPKKRRKYE